jgi:hypothetical protein
MALSSEKMMFAVDFLRRVVNEMPARRFRYLETGTEIPAEQISAMAREDELLKILPEITREFAGKIKPEFTRCHKLSRLSQIDPLWQDIAMDPISGLSIRWIRAYDVMKNDFIYRFDAAFS